MRIVRRSCDDRGRRAGQSSSSASTLKPTRRRRVPGFARGSDWVASTPTSPGSPALRSLLSRTRQKWREGKQHQDRNPLHGSNSASVFSDSFAFNITIVNQSERVFRRAGMVVQYQIDGQETSLVRDSYASVVDAQILPGQQRQVRMVNLDLGTITGDTATVGLYLYEVVIERDQAGVPTRRGGTSSGSSGWLETREPGRAPTSPARSGRVRSPADVPSVS